MLTLSSARAALLLYQHARNIGSAGDKLAQFFSSYLSTPHDSSITALVQSLQRHCRRVEPILKILQLHCATKNSLVDDSVADMAAALVRVESVLSSLAAAEESWRLGGARFERDRLLAELSAVEKEMEFAGTSAQMAMQLLQLTNTRIDSHALLQPSLNELPIPSLSISALLKSSHLLTRDEDGDVVAMFGRAYVRSTCVNLPIPLDDYVPRTSPDSHSSSSSSSSIASSSAPMVSVEQDDDSSAYDTKSDEWETVAAPAAKWAPPKNSNYALHAASAKLSIVRGAASPSFKLYVQSLSGESSSFAFPLTMHCRVCGGAPADFDVALTPADIVVSVLVPSASALPNSPPPSSWRPAPNYSPLAANNIQSDNDHEDSSSILIIFVVPPPHDLTSLELSVLARVCALENDRVGRGNKHLQLKHEEFDILFRRDNTTLMDRDRDRDRNREATTHGGQHANIKHSSGSCNHHICSSSPQSSSSSSSCSSPLTSSSSSSSCLSPTIHITSSQLPSIINRSSNQT